MPSSADPSIIFNTRLLFRFLFLHHEAIAAPILGSDLPWHGGDCLLRIRRQSLFDRWGRSKTRKALEPCPSILTNKNERLGLLRDRRFTFRSERTAKGSTPLAPKGGELRLLQVRHSIAISIISSRRNSFDVIAAATPLVLNEIKSQRLRPFGVGSPAYHVADYGTADAGTSLGLMSKMVESIRERQDGKEVVIHYEDQVRRLFLCFVFSFRPSSSNIPNHLFVRFS